MKKSILGAFFVFFVCLCISGCGTESNKFALEDIETSFHSLESVKDDIVIKCNTEIKNNILVVSCKSESYPESNTSIECIYEDGILSFDINSDDLMGGLMGQRIAEAVSVLQGNKEGDISKTINSEESDSYSVDNEGIEIKLLDTGKIETKIDVNKKIKLIDFSNRYITKEDLIEDASSIKTASTYRTIGYISLMTSSSPYYGTNIYRIEITEEEKLTDNSYKSLLSVLEVIFDGEKVENYLGEVFDGEKVLNYFIQNYSGINEGNKIFDGVEIEIDSESKMLKVKIKEIDLPTL